MRNQEGGLEGHFKRKGVQTGRKRKGKGRKRGGGKHARYTDYEGLVA